MSLTQLESMIWRECQSILQNPKMRKSDLLEWSSGEVEPRDGEISIHIDHLGINAVVASSLDRRKAESFG